MKRGDFFPAAPAPMPLLHRSLRPIDSELPTGPVRILAGPDAAAHPDALEHLLGTEFRIAPQSDRLGLRMKGTDWTTGLPPDRPSGPLPTGAVQFTGAEWIILGVAGGTMGGYPHIAQMISADLDRLGQLRPGDRLRFEVVTLDAARRIDRESRHAFAAFSRIVRAGFDPG